MAFKKGLGEIFISIREKKAPNAIKKLLREAAEKEPLVRQVLAYTYHPDMYSALPEGKPPYKPAEKREDLQGHLYSQWRRMGTFYKGGPYPNMKPGKRESLYIQLLETVDPDDAELLIEIKDGKLAYITEAMVREVFPELLPNVKNKDEVSA